MFAVRMPDGCVGLCDGILHDKQDSSIAFLSYFDWKGIKRVVGFNPEELVHPFLGYIDCYFEIEDLTIKTYKQLSKTVE